MSKSGEKMDVEDVLLSIRQLVSEELKTSSDTASPPKDPDNTDANASGKINAVERDKLVLTPPTSVTESDKLATVAVDLERRMADIEAFVTSNLIKDARVPLSQPGSSQRTVNTQEDETMERLLAHDVNSNREPPLTSSEPESGPSAGAGLFKESIGQSNTESLRETISEILRSELQGELGDRITRNVRKLVNREINRALSSRDVE